MFRNASKTGRLGVSARMLEGKATPGWATMIRRFLNDVSGNFAIMTSIALVPIMGALALGIDYAEMSRQRQDTLNALDAAGIATAREILSSSGKEATEITAYAKEFFEANLHSVRPGDAKLNVVLPQNTTGGGTLKLSADLTYRPYFFAAFAQLMGKTNPDGTTTLEFGAQSEVRLKNTIEVALVLDNSGSMSTRGTGTGEPRLKLLQAAAKQLVETLGKQAEMLKQVERPVQFALVPFAASVNVGPTVGAQETRPWLDTLGISPVHHENFDWTRMTSANDKNKYAEQVAGIWYKRGAGWGEKKGPYLTRFSLYEDIKKETTRSGTLAPYDPWAGCVEARPAPLDSNDEPASTGKPATLFVPMFAPDEPGNVWLDTDGDGEKDRSETSYGYDNNWWTDANDRDQPKQRQRDMRKYFQIKPYGSQSSGTGPNFSCTTNPITPLQDVTTYEGKNRIFNAIDDMKANGNTNVPEGTAWGWRVLSSSEPFTEGRRESEQGNDKIVIVLTDGANTYSPASNENKSTYAAYGYTGQQYDHTGVTRMFMGTSNAVSKTDHRSANFQKALDEHLQTVCQNAKSSGIMMITVSLDLDTRKEADKKAIEALRACASESRYNTDDKGKPTKLYFEATGADLAKTFEKIANELSNLRIVG